MEHLTIGLCGSRLRGSLGVIPFNLNYFLSPKLPLQLQKLVLSVLVFWFTFDAPFLVMSHGCGPRSILERVMMTFEPFGVK